MRFPAPEMRSLISCDSVECRKWRQVPTFFIQVFLLGFRKFFRWISLLFTGLALERLGLTSNYLTSIIPSEVGELKKQNTEFQDNQRKVMDENQRLKGLIGREQACQDALNICQGEKKKLEDHAKSGQ